MAVLRGVLRGTDIVIGKFLLLLIPLRRFQTIMMNNVVAPIIPFMVTYTVQAKRTTDLLFSLDYYVIKQSVWPSLTA
jgi:hypothetical protein